MSCIVLRSNKPVLYRYITIVLMCISVKCVLVIML